MNKTNTIMKNRLKNFIILQYMESSVDLHCMVVPNIPNIPLPKIPPLPEDEGEEGGLDMRIRPPPDFPMLYIIYTNASK